MLKTSSWSRSSKNFTESEEILLNVRVKSIEHEKDDIVVRHGLRAKKVGNKQGVERQVLSGTIFKKSEADKLDICNGERVN